jgi:hypothetical protein
MTTATNGESGMPKAKPPQNGKASLKASRFFTPGCILDLLSLLEFPSYDRTAT